MKQNYLKSLFLMLMMCVGMGAWAENYATWTFASGTAGTNYPSNNTAFTATSGSCGKSTYTMNGSGSTWNSTKGYAFTAVTDMTVTLKLTGNLAAGSSIVFAADMYYNKATNAPMTGFNLTVSENKGSYVTTGLSQTSLSLSTSSSNKSVTYTTQAALKSGDEITLKYTQTGKAGAGQGYVGNITVDGPALTSGGGSSDPVDASWSVDPVSVSVKTTKTATATINTNYDGTLSVSSEDINIATATINGKIITITGVAEGSTTLTVTGEATTSYNAISKTIVVAVTSNDRPENEIFYESFDDNEGTGGNDNKWSGDIAKNTLKFDNEGWLADKGNGANKCAKFGAGSSLGSATTPSITASGNLTLTFKAAAWSGSSESTNLKLSAENASLSESSVTLTKGAWNTYNVNITNATEGFTIKFEGNATSNSRFFLDEVRIVAASAVYTREVTEGKYGTICLANAATKVEGATIYNVAGVNKNGEGVVTGIVLEEETGSLVAGKPYVFKATGSKLVALLSGESVSDVASATGLVGNLGDSKKIDTQADRLIYALSNNKLRKLAGGSLTVGKNKAYFDLTGVGTSEVKAAYIGVDGEEDGIEMIILQNKDNTIYDLQGRRVNGSQKGLYIINGRKVVK